MSFDDHDRTLKIVAFYTRLDGLVHNIITFTCYYRFLFTTLASRVYFMSIHGVIAKIQVFLVERKIPVASCFIS